MAVVTLILILLPIFIIGGRDLYKGIKKRIKRRREKRRQQEYIKVIQLE